MLQNFDLNLAIVMQCDASKDGLGYCLLQNDKPQFCFSKSNSFRTKLFTTREETLNCIMGHQKLSLLYLWSEVYNF